MTKHAPVPHVLAYHEVSEKHSTDVYCMTPETFTAHMWTARLAAERSLQPLSVTFDDGHGSHLRWVMPILNSLRIHGHFFIPTAWMEARSEYAGWDDLRLLAGHGHRIGSHGATHVFLSACTPGSLEEEVRGSRMTLEDKIGASVTSISMPGGRWNENVIRACAIAGYEEVYTSEPGMYRPACVADGLRMPAVIGRFAIRRKTSLRILANYVEGDFFTVNWLRGMYLLRQRTKQLIGDSNYQQIWSSLFRTIPS
ncbi:polysaccharide deacetylase family protein [Terriglobus tenax]|uniref:polysaccharide deacetylase family protein n=1 Tax=Terriglobus tenax TaxID=1111115 RepID=UPI0021DFCBCC|nr:polysaccharide deacetylase family protein [Terriglobus tenax]